MPPHSGPGEADLADGEIPAANPTEFLLVMGLLKTDLETVGLLEIFQRSDVGPSTQKGYLRFVSQMCQLAGDFLNSRQLRHFSDRQTLWTRLEDFARTVHASLDPRETAYTIANEGRRLVECDRVSVAIRKGKKCRIEAVSGQDIFDKRSNTVRLLGKLATAVVRSGEPLWYTGETRDLPPQVEEAVQAYVDESHSKTVAVLPLARPAPPEEDDPKKRVEPEEPIGALVVEQIEDSRVTASLTQRADVVCRHSSTRLGQCHGTPELVPHAGVEGLGQDPLGAAGPNAAQDVEHRRRHLGGRRLLGALAGEVQPRVEGHAGASIAAGRFCRHRRSSARPIRCPRRSSHQRTTSRQAPQHRGGRCAHGSARSAAGRRGATLVHATRSLAEGGS